MSNKNQRKRKSTTTTQDLGELDPLSVAVVTEEETAPAVSIADRKSNGKRQQQRSRSMSNGVASSPSKTRGRPRSNSLGRQPQPQPQPQQPEAAASPKQKKHKSSSNNGTFSPTTTTTTKQKKKPSKQQHKQQQQRRRRRRRTPAMIQKMQRLLELSKQDARQEFELEQQAIFRQLPGSVQQQFGQMGFIKYKNNKQLRPALIVSPYQVPPGPVRHEWMDVYYKMIEQGRPLDKMSHLVFLYDDASTRVYTMVSQSRFIPYDQATLKMKEWSKYARHKQEQHLAALKAKKKSIVLSPEDLQKIKGHDWFQEDLLKPPHERIRGVFPFQEGYELLSMTDVEVELSDDDNDLEDIEDTSDDDDDDEATELLLPEEEEDEETLAIAVLAGEEDEHEAYPVPETATFLEQPHTQAAPTDPPDTTTTNNNNNNNDELQATVQQTLHVLTGLQTRLMQFTTPTPTNHWQDERTDLLHQLATVQTEFHNYKVETATQLASLEHQLQTVHEECTAWKQKATRRTATATTTVPAPPPAEPVVPDQVESHTTMNPTEEEEEEEDAANPTTLDHAANEEEDVVNPNHWDDCEV